VCACERDRDSVCAREGECECECSVVSLRENVRHDSVLCDGSFWVVFRQSVVEED